MWMWNNTITTCISKGDNQLCSSLDPSLQKCNMEESGKNQEVTLPKAFYRNNCVLNHSFQQTTIAGGSGTSKHWYSQKVWKALLYNHERQAVIRNRGFSDSAKIKELPVNICQGFPLCVVRWLAKTLVHQFLFNCCRMSPLYCFTPLFNVILLFFFKKNELLLYFDFCSISSIYKLISSNFV